ncbi:solute carrier family 12 member 9 isoform X1 [Pocillopora verrucosa]|uniref:solute carrier family 12 member 9 isoform X1 n=1 Tax=Pocillopora verrucosa TaxID=203993 RepID=UPI00333FD756
MATFSGSPRPLMGRYTLLPSASSWETVSEEAEGSLGMTEGYSLMLSNPLRNIGEEQSSQKYVSVTAEEPEHRKKLSTFFGVVVPVTLSMFSVILFLRLGFVVGQAGLVLSIGMFVIAYFVVGLTILSISAIATNGAVKEGGAYYMISRTLGPEFGGSIGVIFYFANIFASALYLLGFVEALLNNFQESSPNIFRSGTWYSFLYASIVLFFCLIVCLIGSGMFAKTSFIIFLAVMVAVSSSIVSFLIVKHKGGILPGVHSGHSPPKNVTYRYSGWNSTTLHKNLWPNFTKDYTTEEHQTSLTVFGVLFNGVTGVMAGANISGDLKKPGYAIPFGTLGASVFTFIVYLLLVVFTSATCPRSLLRNNYNYLKEINKVEWLITMGTFAATLSAALSCLIGASRILQAIAKDDLLGVILRPFSKVTRRNGEPLRAVLMSWFFVQVVLFIGNVNKVASLVSMFFLLSYGITNVACFVLKVASAPNFRPTFQYFSWQSALLGAVFCFVIMFLVDYKLAALAFALMVILFVVISLRTPPTPWGDVSQALIYHQVRKYLLRLDLRKDHVKFWRPQVLLLVSNPRSGYPLIDFVNDIKKGGLYILGHVQEGEFDAQLLRGQKRELTTWLNFVDCTEIKAFVELTIARTIRAGARNLLMASGLGGMKPNTLILGFYDHELPVESFSRGIFRKPRLPFMRVQKKDEIYRSVQLQLPPLRTHPGHQKMTLKDYVGIIKDAVLMDKNVCIARNFAQLDKNALGKEGYIDVWPMNTTVVGEAGLVLGPYDFTFLLTLQLSCVLHMVPFWENRSKLRVMQIVETEDDEGNHQTQHRTLTNLLKELRIPAEVRMIHVTQESLSLTRNADGLAPSTNWYRTVNQLIRIHSTDAFVVFTGLPHPPNEENMAQQFIQDITVLSDNLPPVMMVYGKSKVVSTSL